MITRKATLPPTPKIRETNCRKRKPEKREPFGDTGNNQIHSKKAIKKSTEMKGRKEAVVNSIKLKPTSRAKIRYTSHKMILLKKAIKKSMEKKGGKEAKFAKTMRIIKPKRSKPKRPRRLAFKIRPSRLSTMSNSQDLPIIQPGKGPIVIDLEENMESLISKKRPRPSAIKLNGPSYPKMSNISKKQSAEVALTLDIKKRTKRAKFSQQGPKKNVATPDLHMNRATPSTTNVVGSSIPEQSQSPKINKKPSLKATLTSIERKMRTKMLKSSQESQKEKVVTPNPLTTRATRSSTTKDYVFLYLVR